MPPSHAGLTVSHGRVTVRWRRRGLLALLGLAGCSLPDAGGLQPPTVNIVNIRPVEAGLLEQTLDLDLRIVNPNPEPLAVNGMRYTVELDGGRLGAGTNGELFEVPRFGSTVVPVRLYVATSDLISRFGAMAVRGAGGSGGAISYRISGAMFSGTGLGSSLPFDGGGTVDVPAMLATSP